MDGAKKINNEKCHKQKLSNGRAFSDSIVKTIYTVTTLPRKGKIKR
jgi:hypothetical protein